MIMSCLCTAHSEMAEAKLCASMTWAFLAADLDLLQATGSLWHFIVNAVKG